MNIPIDLSNWGSYEYIGPGEIFHPVHFEPNGGPGDQPFIWANDESWSIDTPESPNSILALLFYPLWLLEPLYDLREASLEFCLRGDDLDLKEAQCYFWVHTATPHSTRWHYIHQPLPIADGCWDAPHKITLANDQHSWHHSFSSDPASKRSLSTTLQACTSFGFSFVGFSEKVTGRLSLSAFSLNANIARQWPYNANFGEAENGWLTVSRHMARQIPLQVTPFNSSMLSSNKEQLIWLTIVMNSSNSSQTTSPFPIWALPVPRRPPMVPI